MFDQGPSLPVLAGLVSFSLILILAGFMWRRGHRLSLRHQLLVAVVGVAAVSVFLIVSILVWRIRVTLTDQIGQSFVLQATSNSQRLGVELAREIDLIRNLSEDEVFFNRITGTSETELAPMPAAERMALFEAREEGWTTDNDEALHATVLINAASIELTDFRDNFPAHVQLMVTDRYGSLVAAAGLTPAHYYYGDQAWWQEAWQRRIFDIPYVGHPQVSPGSAGTTVDIAVPIHPPQTLVARGLLRSRFMIDALQLFADADPPGETGELNLVDETGLVLYSSNPDRVGTQLPLETWRTIVETPSDWHEVIDETGQVLILGHDVLAPPPERPSLDELGWSVVVQQTKAEALFTVNRLSQIALLGGLTALALVVVVGGRVTQQMIRPIEELTAAASALAEDHLESRASVSGPEELRTLGQAFNRMTDRLQKTLGTLEQRVFERTHRLELVAMLGERLNAILDLDTLLVEVVEQIKEKFDYYHVHIYLLDEAQENLLIAEGAGEPGRALKAAGHQIPRQAVKSLVARAARSGQIVKVDNVREAIDWLPNPLLPDTYSEMAVPIIMEGQVLGVLDVQEDKIAALDKGDANVLRFLANQIAVAVRNARLFEEVEAGLAEARELQLRYVEQAWEKKKVAGKGVRRVQFSLGESSTLDQAAIARARQAAMAHQEPHIVSLAGQDSAAGPDITEAAQARLRSKSGPDNDKPPVEEPASHQALVAPLKLQGTVIGNLQLHEEGTTREWTESELALIEAVIDQVVQTAENLRLLDSIQERASREQLISRISAKLRRAPDMETLLEIGTTELERVLNPARTFIQLGTKEELAFRQAEEAQSNGRAASAEGPAGSDGAAGAANDAFRRGDDG